MGTLWDHPGGAGGSGWGEGCLCPSTEAPSTAMEDQTTGASEQGPE